VKTFQVNDVVRSDLHSSAMSATIVAAGFETDWPESWKKIGTFVPNWEPAVGSKAVDILTDHRVDILARFKAVDADEEVFWVHNPSAGSTYTVPYRHLKEPE
jgi:hypothetical protein